MKQDEKPFQPFGGYERLRSYQMAELLYDATVVFCERFYAQDRRMTDQMVQAARSGVRNISEGSGAAVTSKKSEMFLTNVARASLRDELLPDYRSFLRQRGLALWDPEDRRTLEMRRRLQHRVAPGVITKPGVVTLSGLDGLMNFVRGGNPEAVGNALPVTQIWGW
jgi:hypothetical protein